VAAYYAAPPGPRAEAPSAVPGTAAGDPYAQARANAAAALRRARQGIERRLAGLAADEPPPGEAQRLRTAAEWLLALASQVAPHQAVLMVPLEEGSLEIPLEQGMTPVEQAQRMFRRAAKSERAEVFIPQRRAELQGDLALVDQLALDLQAAANQPEIAAVQAELRAAGLLGAQALPTRGSGSPGRGSATPALQGGLLRVRSAQGLEIVVGRNARQNERVTFGEAHPEDLWLHARGVPGSHTIIRTGGQVPSEETVRAAAQLAAYHSGARGERAVDVIVTRRRWVQRAPGGKVGQVLVKQEERVVTVPGELPADLPGAGAVTGPDRPAPRR
jgi:predicted ribosome quality control (RQC) complex YloA/Tae2 family protein